MSDTTIEDLGKWQWSLSISNGEVVARQPIPHDGAVVYSTRDRPNSAHKNSEYRLDAREVVRRYVAQSETERTFSDLIDAVQGALADATEVDR